MTIRSAQDYARYMQRAIASRLDRIGEWVSVKTAKGARLHARYHWWGARLSANPAEHLRTAQRQLRLAHDMNARPREYRFPARAPGQTCWRKFQELQAARGAEVSQA